MGDDLIGFETVIDKIKGWPTEGDSFPRPASRDNQGRPLWDRAEIERFAHRSHGLPYTT